MKKTVFVSSFSDRVSSTSAVDSRKSKHKTFT